MRALIVGWGSIGRRHAECLRTIAPDCEIVVWRQQAADTAISRAAVDIADRVVFSAGDAVASIPDFAVIANPAPLHVSTACTLLQHGIPLLIEKPLASDPRDVAALRDMLQHAKAPLMVGYVLRFHPANIGIKSILEDGAIGRPLHARLLVGQHLADWRISGDWKTGVSARRETGGGALLELSHEIDLAMWFFGMPTGVTARIAPTSLPEIEVEDNADLLLDFPSGLIVNIHLDMVSRPARRAIEIMGTDGAVTVDLVSGTSALWQNALGEVNTSVFTPPSERNHIYKQQLQHFLDCLDSGSPPSIDLDAGAAVLAAVDAARRSAADGRRMLV
ncbi:MAG: Gfo/Idh/MocA family oxidoreductase [Alphaproteobacteria bacterium]|nr:Gfo/Idh/MocA family oxidoreductase [Alphaproteobacteria bacterium]